MWSERPVTSPPPPPPPTPPDSHRTGPFEITRDDDEMVLRLENRGELSLHVCLMALFVMFAILTIGVVSVIHAADQSGSAATMSAARLIAPRQNYLGFVWAASAIFLVVAVPIYVTIAYRSALVFRFSRPEDAFCRGRHRICRLRRVEQLSVHEEPDPDDRYLYLLEVVYDDGQRMLLYNGYDERETLNLANEISTFVHVPVAWK